MNFDNTLTKMIVLFRCSWACNLLILNGNEMNIRFPKKRRNYRVQSQINLIIFLIWLNTLFNFYCKMTLIYMIHVELYHFNAIIIKYCKTHDRSFDVLGNSECKINNKNNKQFYVNSVHLLAMESINIWFILYFVGHS